MKVLFCTSHPAHVHLFSKAIEELESTGNEVHVAARNRGLTTYLLDDIEVNYTTVWSDGDSFIGHGIELVKCECRLYKLVRQFSPDVIVSRLNPAAAHISSLSGIPNIVFDDSGEVVHLAGKLTHPFSSVICTPSNFERNLGDSQIRYDGFHELAYLHPDRFKPDPHSLQEHGVEPEEDYAVVRFVSWGAHHDFDQQGLTSEGKNKLINLLSNRGNVYITAEGDLPSKFEEYKLPIPPEKIHHLLSFADLYIGDSQTMATESAVLGTPAVRCNTFAGDNDMSNFERLEKEYGLLFSTSDENEALDQAKKWMEYDHSANEWEQRHQELLNNCIDVTAFMNDIIRRYANS